MDTGIQRGAGRAGQASHPLHLAPAHLSGGARAMGIPGVPGVPLAPLAAPGAWLLPHTSAWQSSSSGAERWLGLAGLLSFACFPSPQSLDGDQAVLQRIRKYVKAIHVSGLSELCFEREWASLDHRAL